MADRPILFSAPMIRALLDGRKTQTRRIIKPPAGLVPAEDPDHWSVSHWNRQEIAFVAWPADDAVVRKVPQRFIVGDRLWVKETWRTEDQFDDRKPSDVPPGEYVAYGDDAIAPLWLGAGRIRQSIFMPRWASRLTLLVTDVRVERLQDCSEVDAIQEGVTLIEESLEDPVEAYAALWDSINGAGAWEANPWVVAVSFKVEQRNIDAGGEG